MRRPSPIAWWMPGGRSADASRCATRTNFCVASSSSQTSLSVSAVSPDGPGAAAFRARRKLVRRRSAGMSTGSGGSYWSSAGSGAWYGACGRRLGSVSSSRAIIDSTTETTVHVLIENIIVGKINHLNGKVGMDLGNIDWLVH